jgi:N-acyl-L-homoserine lactone synthetase
MKDNLQLSKGMYSDRKSQFIQRLEWKIKANSRGLEIDEYDTNGALYIVWVDREGQHLGSLRLAPTTRLYMIQDHFSEYFPNFKPKSEEMWEVSRFCISPRNGRTSQHLVSRELVKGACLFALENNIQSYVGLCFPSMLRVYRKIGWSPNQTIKSSIDRNLIFASWHVQFEQFLKLFRKRTATQKAGLPMLT